MNRAQLKAAILREFQRLAEHRIALIEQGRSPEQYPMLFNQVSREIQRLEEALLSMSAH